MGEFARRRKLPGRRIPVPFLFVWIAARMASWVSRWLFGPTGKLPSMLIPRRLAVFKPLRFSNRLLRESIGWKPRVSIDEALERTFGARS